MTKVKFIRRDIPAEISEEGGAFIQLVGQQTVGLADSIKEAIRSLYCVGEASLVEGYFKGLLRSVFAGIKLDGCARCIGDIRFFPVCGGTFDLEKGWDPLVNDVRIKAQLLNGVDIDISDWSFEDVTEGRVNFKLASLESEDGLPGIVKGNKKVLINGSYIPDADKLAITWTCGTKSGTLDGTQFSASCSRIDISSTALATLTSAEDGLPVVFTVKGCYNKVTIKGLFKYVVLTPEITKVKQGTRTDNLVGFGTGAENAFVLTGTFPGGFKSDDGLRMYGAPTTATGTDFTAQMSLASYVTASTETTITIGDGIENDSEKPDADWQDKVCKITLVRDGVEYSLTANFKNP